MPGGDIDRLKARDIDLEIDFLGEKIGSKEEQSASIALSHAIILYYIDPIFIPGCIRFQGLVFFTIALLSQPRRFLLSVYYLRVLFVHIHKYL